VQRLHSSRLLRSLRAAAARRRRRGASRTAWTPRTSWSAPPAATSKARHLTASRSRSSPPPARSTTGTIPADGGSHPSNADRSAPVYTERARGAARFRTGSDPGGSSP